MYMSNTNLSSTVQKPRNHNNDINWMICHFIFFKKKQELLSASLIPADQAQILIASVSSPHTFEKWKVLVPPTYHKLLSSKIWNTKRQYQDHHISKHLKTIRQWYNIEELKCSTTWSSRWVWDVATLDGVNKLWKNESLRGKHFWKMRWLERLINH